jgi:hypothetical protein
LAAEADRDLRQQIWGLNAKGKKVLAANAHAPTASGDDSNSLKTYLRESLFDRKLPAGLQFAMTNSPLLQKPIQVRPEIPSLPILSVSSITDLPGHVLRLPRNCPALDPVSGVAEIVAGILSAQPKPKVIESHAKKLIVSSNNRRNTLLFVPSQSVRWTWVNGGSLCRIAARDGWGLPLILANRNPVSNNPPHKSRLYQPSMS